MPQHAIIIEVNLNVVCDTALLNFTCDIDLKQRVFQYYTTCAERFDRTPKPALNSNTRKHQQC